MLRVSLQTPLAERHRELGAHFVEFAGWQMPVRYGSALEEHGAVRERAGIFDVSHMGEIWVEGRGGADGLAHALVSDPRSLAAGRAEYSMICAEDGGILDDIILYRPGPHRFLIVANAANVERVSHELSVRLHGFEATLTDRTSATALIALQGPQAERILASRTDADLGSLRYYSITDGFVAGRMARIARTGYTGEDGFEIFLAWDDALAVWDALLREGAQPCGLAARDTLRLEAGMPLYGNELDEHTTPFEAGLGRVVQFGKPFDFVGREALAAAADHPRKELIGLVMRGRGIARHGYPVHRPGEEHAWGTVTSGGPSPTLGAPIAMAYVRTRRTEPGTPIEVEIRGARTAAEIVRLPFYRRTRRAQDGIPR